MTQQSPRPGVRAAQALGLTVLFITAAFLTALLGMRITSVFDDLQTAAAGLSTLCAAVAAFAMLVDAMDLWFRGRTMTPRTVRLIRLLVFIAVLAALVASFVGNVSLVIPLLAPSMLVYVFVARKRPDVAPAGPARSRSGSRPGSSAPTKARQRRGGKKHR